MRVKYYCEKFSENWSRIFSKKRINEFGLLLAIYNFIVFMCHRNNSFVQMWAERKKDIIVQKYLYENYIDIIDKFKNE